MAIIGRREGDISQENKSILYRSLVANLGAANHFTIEHLDEPKNKQLLENAKIFYTAVNPLVIDR